MIEAILFLFAWSFAGMLPALIFCCTSEKEGYSKKKCLFMAVLACPVLPIAYFIDEAIDKLIRE